MKATRHLSALIASAAAFAAAPAASAQQCPQPDGLNGPCCAVVNPTLPLFPPVAMPGSGVCYEACVPGEKTCLEVQIGMPVPTSCTEFTAQLAVSECDGGAVLLNGALRLNYTRTWGESSAGQPGAQDLQVWRLLAKVDLQGPAAAVGTCPVPSCLLAFPDAFYYGYVDYARSCVSGDWRAVLVLFHGCDEFVHDMLLSDHPGMFHPTTSFAIVAPDTMGNPFAPGAFPAPGGFLQEEAVRTVRNQMGAVVCAAEEPLQQGIFFPFGSACLCPPAFLPPQLTASRLSGQGTCPDPLGNPSSLKSLNLFGITPWLELMSHSLGQWTTNASYPGAERVWVSEGPFDYHDSCGVIPGVAPGNFLEIHYGAMTAAGFPPSQVQDDGGGGAAPPLPNRFLDLASNFSHATGLGMPVQLPVLGSVRPTDHLIYVNPE